MYFVWGARKGAWGGGGSGAKQGGCRWECKVRSLTLPPPSPCPPTGPIFASLATQRNLGVLSLGNNRLSCDLTAFATALTPLPALTDSYAASPTFFLFLEPRLHLLHTLTGPIPASLATQHNLGVLSLGNNRLSGDLTAFATALTDP